MPTLKGFLFDLDGVLVDTAKFHFQAWRRLAKELNIDFGPQENEQLKGISRRKSLEKILEWGHTTLPEEEMEALMAQKNNWYLELVQKMGPEEALPGATDFLDRSLALNLKIGLGSASKNAVHILEQLKLKDRFQVIIDGTKTTKSKPDPQVFERGAEALGLQPEETVVFEDSIAGIEAAIKGGFRSVGIGKVKQLKKAELVIPGLASLTPAEVINKLNF